MKLTATVAAFAGLLAGAVVLPGFAITAKGVSELSVGQTAFIRELDDALGSKFLEVATSPAAVPLVKSASLACGNTSLQHQALTAAGATAIQTTYAIERFENLFCADEFS